MRIHLISGVRGVNDSPAWVTPRSLTPEAEMTPPWREWLPYDRDDTLPQNWLAAIFWKTRCLNFQQICRPTCLSAKIVYLDYKITAHATNCMDRHTLEIAKPKLDSHWGNRYIVRGDIILKVKADNFIMEIAKPKFSSYWGNWYTVRGDIILKVKADNFTMEIAKQN